MEWDDLKVFLAVAKAKTLSGAARELSRSQPTVGRRVKALEAALDRRLFRHTKEGYELTESGEILLRHAKLIESETFSLQRALLGTQNPLAGLIRISTFDWFAVVILEPIVARFLSTHKAMTIEVVTNDRPYNLTRRETDLALRLIPFAEPDVIQRKVAHVPYGFYGKRSLRRPDHAGNISVITLNDDLMYVPDMIWLRNKYPDASISLKSNSRIVQAQSCAVGLGYAVLPVPLGEKYRQLTRHSVKEGPPGRDIWMGYHSDMKNLPRLKVFTEFLERNLVQ